MEPDETLPPDALAPSLAAIEAMAQEALDAMPALFRERLGALVLHVEDFAEDSVLDDLGIADAFALTGLYQGVSLIHDSASFPQAEPARVFLYRRPILDEWAARGDVGLRELVAHVLIHELAHHFGWSDDEIDAILDT